MIFHGSDFNQSADLKLFYRLNLLTERQCKAIPPLPGVEMHPVCLGKSQTEGVEQQKG